MYINTLLHCYFCIQIITDHFLLSKVSRPIHTIPGINAHLLYPILCSWKYSISHKLLYCSLCIFGCFHDNQRCVASCHYFYTLGISLVQRDLMILYAKMAVQKCVHVHSTTAIVQRHLKLYRQLKVWKRPSKTAYKWNYDTTQCIYEEMPSHMLLSGCKSLLWSIHIPKKGLCLCYV